MTQTAAGPASETDLNRLLEAEADTATSLAAARAEGERLVTVARARASEREAALGGELERAARALEVSIAADRDVRCDAALTEADAKAAAWDRIGDADLARLADTVVSALVEGGS